MKNEKLHNLTKRLQWELESLNSSVTLLTPETGNKGMNYKDWAWADLNNREIQVSSFIEKKGKHIQLEESGIIACIGLTDDIKEIALITDLWLNKRQTYKQLGASFKSIKVSDNFINLSTLSNDKLIKLK